MYFAPYWGYKFPLSNSNISIAPYIGPYGGYDLGIKPLGEEVNSIYVKVTDPDGAQFGLHLGAKLFLSPNFYFDLHCMKSFTSVGQVQFYNFKNYNYNKIQFKMFSLMLGLGVQF